MELNFLIASPVTNSYICAAGFFLHQPKSLLSFNYGHVIVFDWSFHHGTVSRFHFFPGFPFFHSR